jgi:hypothetical protein
MLSKWCARISRAFLTAVLVAFLIAAVPQSVSSAPNNKVQLKIQIAAVQRGESVSIRGEGFPTKAAFTVRIGDPDKLAVKGTVVDEFTTEKAGDFDATYTIPEEMRDKRVIGIRMDSDAGYYAYTWFMNTTQNGLIADKDALQPELTFADVVQSESVTIIAKNLAPNTSYRVRVGPHESFFRNYVALTNLLSSEKGEIEATIDLPEVVEESEFVTVRIDAVNLYVSSRSVSSTFRNQDGGTFVPASDLIKVIPCTVINTRSLPTMRPGQDFDAVWTIKNTGNYDWEAGTVNYRFYSGARIHKYESSYHIPSALVRGNTHTIMIDMKAPDTLGWHSVTWEVIQDTRSLCRMGILIFVKGDS